MSELPNCYRCGAQPCECSDGLTIYHGDCLDILPLLEAGSVDMTMTDPPYGTTACEWDSIIPLEPMWEQLKRVIKSNGAIVLMASQPFTTTLIASNMKMFKYCWVWRKERGVGFQVAKYCPMSETEDCVVFCNGKRKMATYNPQMIKLDEPKKESFASSKSDSSPLANVNNGSRIATHRHPKNVIEIKRDPSRIHPTQKPVALMEYMIRTYTNEGEAVLDFCLGSGTTLRACKDLGRRGVGIELEERYCEIAARRLEQGVLF